MTSSPARRLVEPGPVTTSSTATRRFPPGPTISALAPAAIMAGTLSAAGEALQRLPAMVAPPWTCVEPISWAASTTPGHSARSSACSPNSAQVTAAPIRHPRSPRSMRLIPGNPLDVDNQIGICAFGPDLHQEIGAPRLDAGSALRSSEQSNSLIECRRRLEPHGQALLVPFVTSEIGPANMTRDRDLRFETNQKERSAPAGRELKPACNPLALLVRRSNGARSGRGPCRRGRARDRFDQAARIGVLRVGYDLLGRPCSTISPR